MKDNKKIMEILKESKILAVSIDPGFNGTKININKSNDMYLSYILPMTDDLEIAGSSTDKQITYQEKGTNKNAIKYVIGDVAAEMVSRYPENGPLSSYIKDLKILEKFFTMDESIYMTRAAILYAIINYSQSNDIGFKLENLNDWTIYLEVTLPHSIKEEAGTKMLKLIEPTDIIMYIGNKEYNITLNIDGNNMRPASQVMSMFASIVYDEEGRINAEKNEEMREKLPAIFVDAGYRTIGIATLLSGSQARIENSTSITDYAMITVNELVAQELNKTIEKDDSLDYIKIQEYDVDSYINQKKDLRYKVKATAKDDELVQEVGFKIKTITNSEILQIRENVLNEQSKAFAKYILTDYGVGDSKIIYIAGGTGVPYKEHLNSYVTEITGGAISVELLDTTYNGGEAAPVYTIVNGAHKELLNGIRTRYESNRL